MKVIKYKYYDEFWGAKYPYYEYNFEFEKEDEDKILDVTIDKIVEVINPKYMENELMTFLGDDGKYYDIEIDLTEYINDAYKEIVKNKDKYFDDDEKFIKWFKKAKIIYKNYIEE